jgi:RNA polymerase sigma factor (sigma-70 family)
MTASHPEDLELVRQAAAGDVQARERLAKRLACVGRMAAAMNREGAFGIDLEALRDVAQSAVVRLLGKLDEFRGDATIETWARGFLRGELLNAVRSLRRQRAHFEPLTPDQEQASGPAPAEQLEASELPLVVARCLERLPPGDQELLRRHIGGEQEFAAIAAATGATLDSLKSRYYRALGLVRRCLGLAPKGNQGDLS